MEHNLSRVRSIPWKLVSTLRPCTSSAISLNLRKVTSSFWRSARETSNTRPFSPSEAIPKKRKTFSSLSSLGRWSCHFRNVVCYATMGKTMAKLLKSLSPFLTGRMFVHPNILQTLRRTTIHFLIELLVCWIWFEQSKLYFILNWLVMRCKLRPELAADGQQTAWSKM